MKARTLLIQLAGVLCLAASSLHADPYTQHGELKPSTPPSRGEQPPEITPNAGPKTVWAADPFFTADFIYWTARQEGLAYAISGADIGILSLDTAPGRIHQPDWSFEPGFKVAAGVKIQHDGWDVYANYTWLHSDARDSISNPNGFLPTLPNFLLILFNILPNLPSGELSLGKTHWSHHFNTIDLELGRDYYISRFITLRPHVGLKGSWQDQDVRTSYHITDGTTLSIHNHQDSWGIGVRTGLDTCWYFTRSFGLYGDFALSGLWSGFNTSRKDTNSSPNNPENVYLDTGEVIHSVKPVIEFGIGLRYEYLYRNDDFRFLIQAGWEEQIWIDNNHLVDVAEYGDKGSLSLQGFTLEARLDF
ncbi:MAG: MOMP family protein [Simkaniaceae bacterium]|nr:MAG: MOMP family protein [Simkaniaceae bacterium]